MSEAVQTDEFNRRIAEEYMNQLKNRTFAQPKAIITFSGIPGSGKTTLARKLEDELKAQYIHHDGLRKIIELKGDDPRKYSMIPISRIVINTILEEDANKLIILDASIDRSWNVFFEDKKAFNIDRSVIIRFAIPYDLIKQRQLQRDGKVNSKFNEFVSQFEACKQSIQADIELSDEYDFKEVTDTVRKFLK